MAQRNDYIERKKAFWDGTEVEGLVQVSEISLEKHIVEVPEFSAIRKIASGIVAMPEIVFTYKVRAGGTAKDFFRAFFQNNQTKDCVVHRVDATATKFSEITLSGCECTKYVEPEFDAANPTYAKLTITVVPFEVTFIL